MSGDDYYYYYYHTSTDYGMHYDVVLETLFFTIDASNGTLKNPKDGHQRDFFQLRSNPKSNFGLERQPRVVQGDNLLY